MKKFNDYTSQLVGESVEAILSDKAKLSLYKKSSNSDIPVSILEEVYRRGYTIWNKKFNGTPEQFAFDRVNSFIAGGFAAQLDEDLLDEKRGLWDNIHAKRARIKAGSGERMRKPGSKGAPTDAALKASQNEDADPCWTGYKQIGTKKKGGRSVPNCVPVKEELNKKVMTPEQIADKHGVSVESLNKCLKRGIQVEKEHTTHAEEARRIALAHLGEDPNYYKKLDKAGLEEGKVQDAAKIAAILGSLGGHAYNVSNVASHSDDPALAAATVASYLHPASRLLQAAPSVFKVNKAGKGENEFLRQKRYNKSVKEDAEAHSKDFRKPSSRFIGSNELVDIYKSQTPGQIIKKVIREHLQEVAMAMPPQVTPPAIVGQVRPGIRVAPRPTEISGRATGRMAGQAGSMTGKVQTTRAAPPRAPTSTMPAGQAGSMRATPTKTSMSFSQGGSNIGQKMAAAKQTSPVVKGMADAGRQAMTKVAPAIATGARALTGVAGTAASLVAPYAAKEIAKSYEKGHSQGLKPHDVGGEKTSDVFKRMKEPSQGRSISSYEKDVLTPKTYETPKAAPAPKVDAPTPPSRPEFFSRGEAFKAAREKAGGGEGQFKYDNKSFQTNVPGEKYIAPEKQKQTGIEAESGGKTLKKIKEAIAEATYKGKTVPLNKPMKGDVKKSKVFVDPDGDGKAQKVNFGDKNMSIKKDQPARKRSYCARSGGISGTNDKTSANYWSRRAWNCEETEVNELSVPAGTTGKREKVSTPMVAVRMASGKIEKHPPGKSGSSGGGGNGAE